ncbi:MAG: DUF1566 domain-containing protein [bacterium]
MNMDLKTKKAFTLVEIAVVFVIIALIAVVGIKITKSGTNLTNKYMSYAAFTNLKDGIGELIADDTTLPAYGVAPTTVTCVPPIISVTPATSSASIPYTTSASTTNGTFTVTGTGGSGTVTITNPTVPSGSSVTMSPTTFSIANGGTQTVTFTATSPANSASTGTFTFGFSASIAGGNTATHTHTQIRDAAPPPPLTPDPAATCDDSGVTFSSLQIASADSALADWSTAIAECTAMGTGWHLPSKNELCSLYKYRAYISAPMGAAYYWSATEYSTAYAWFQHFASGNQLNDHEYNGFRVRCVK